MFFKKSEKKHMNPYVAITVGTLAMIGAVSIVKCGKKVVRCACDKMTCMVKQIMGKSEIEQEIDM
jgi:hypothetical protein